MLHKNGSHLITKRKKKKSIMSKHEIRFRGIIENTNEWTYGYLVIDGMLPTKAAIIDFADIDHGIGSYSIEKVKIETVGQMWEPSIGLTVFTDDLLMANCAPSGSKEKKQRICKVVFGKRGMGISVWHKQEWWAYESIDFTTAQIIGNIHQHSHILK